MTLFKTFKVVLSRLKVCLKRLRLALLQALQLREAGLIPYRREPGPELLPTELPAAMRHHGISRRPHFEGPFDLEMPCAIGIGA